MFKKNLSIFVIILLVFSSLIYAQETAPETTPTTIQQETTPTTIQETTPETTPTTQPEQEIPTTTLPSEQPALRSEPAPPKEIDINQLPPGCHLEKNEFSEFVKCE